MQCALKLYLVYEPNGGDPPVKLARLTDHELVIEAAHRAIEASEAHAEGAFDELLAQLRRDESHRLRRSLELLLPELVAA